MINTLSSHTLQSCNIAEILREIQPSNEELLRAFGLYYQLFLGFDSDIIIIQAYIL